MLGYMARHQPPYIDLLPCLAWGMPLMPQNMLAEAHCQEERGINKYGDWLCVSGNMAQFNRTGGSI